MGVFTLHVHNIKGFAFEFARASCVNEAWGLQVQLYLSEMLKISKCCMKKRDLPCRQQETIQANRSDRLAWRLALPFAQKVRLYLACAKSSLARKENFEWNCFETTKRKCRKITCGRTLMPTLSFWPRRLFCERIRKGK